MSKHTKSIKRLFTVPKDYKWRELCSLLNKLGFEQLEGNGSRVKFFNKDKDVLIAVHNPHPDSTIKPCYLRMIVKKLKGMGVSE